MRNALLELLAIVLAWINVRPSGGSLGGPTRPDRYSIPPHKRNRKSWRNPNTVRRVMVPINIEVSHLVVWDSRLQRDAWAPSRGLELFSTQVRYDDRETSYLYWTTS